MGNNELQKKEYCELGKEKKEKREEIESEPFLSFVSVSPLSLSRTFLRRKPTPPRSFLQRFSV